MSSFDVIGQNRSFFDIEADPVWKNPAFVSTNPKYSDFVASGSHRFDHLYDDTIQNHSSHQFQSKIDGINTIGINFYHSGLFKKSYSNTFALGGSYAYTFSKSKIDINIGVYAGFTHSQNKNINYNNTSFDLNLGVAFYNEKFSAGVSLINVSNPNFNRKKYLEDLAVSFQFIQLFDISKDFQLQTKAYAFLQSQSNVASIHLDFIYDEWFSFGTFYRTNIRSGISLATYLGDVFKIAYTYEYDFDILFRESIKGNHMIQIQFSI